MRHLDLFSGIGGFALAGQWAWPDHELVAFCEKDKYCQKVLRKHWPHVQILDDIYNLKGDEFPADVITGGFPCQPFSTAGKRAGESDDRYLWPEMLRVIREARPTWVVGENVAGIVSMGLDQVLADLEVEGYACQAFIIPACAVDAPHRRDRVWIVGHSRQQRERGGPQEAHREDEEIWANGVGHAHKAIDAGQDVADTDQQEQPALPVNANSRFGLPTSARTDTRWLPEPSVGRVAHGIPNRVDRLRGLGNAIVPAVAYEILKNLSLS